MGWYIHTYIQGHRPGIPASRDSLPTLDSNGCNPAPGDVSLCVNVLADYCPGILLVINNSMHCPEAIVINAEICV